MKAFLVLALVSVATDTAIARGIDSGSGKVLVDADFGLTFETPGDGLVV